MFRQLVNLLLSRYSSYVILRQVNGFCRQKSAPLRSCRKFNMIVISATRRKLPVWTDPYTGHVQCTLVGACVRNTSRWHHCYDVIGSRDVPFDCLAEFNGKEFTVGYMVGLHCVLQPFFHLTFFSQVSTIELKFQRDRVTGGSWPIFKLLTGTRWRFQQSIARLIFVVNSIKLRNSLPVNSLSWGEVKSLSITLAYCKFNG